MSTNDELHERIEHNMTNHAPANEDIVARFEALREFAKTFSHAIVDLCPEGRDRSLALTHAEDALMRGVAAIARNQDVLFDDSFLPDDLDEAVDEGVVPTYETAEDLEEAAATVLTERATAGNVAEVLDGEPAGEGTPEVRTRAELGSPDPTPVTYVGAPDNDPTRDPGEEN